jgi:hypothetical protein
MRLMRHSWPESRARWLHWRRTRPPCHACSTSRRRSDGLGTITGMQTGITPRHPPLLPRDQRASLSRTRRPHRCSCRSRHNPRRRDHAPLTPPRAHSNHSIHRQLSRPIRTTLTRTRTRNRRRRPSRACRHRRPGRHAARHAGLRAPQRRRPALSPLFSGRARRHTFLRHQRHRRRARAALTSRPRSFTAPALASRHCRSRSLCQRQCLCLRPHQSKVHPLLSGLLSSRLRHCRLTHSVRCRFPPPHGPRPPPRRLPPRPRVSLLPSRHGHPSRSLRSMHLCLLWISRSPACWLCLWPQPRRSERRHHRHFVRSSRSQWSHRRVRLARTRLQPRWLRQWPLQHDLSWRQPLRMCLRLVHPLERLPVLKRARRLLLTSVPLLPLPLQLPFSLRLPLPTRRFYPTSLAQTCPRRRRPATRRASRTANRWLLRRRRRARPCFLLSLPPRISTPTLQTSWTADRKMKKGGRGRR